MGFLLGLLEKFIPGGAQSALKVGNSAIGLVALAPIAIWVYKHPTDVTDIFSRTLFSLNISYGWAAVIGLIVYVYVETNRKS